MSWDELSEGSAEVGMPSTLIKHTLCVHLLHLPPACDHMAHYPLVHWTCVAVEESSSRLRHSCRFCCPALWCALLLLVSNREQRQPG